MKRKEIKEVLLELGASLKLLEMPAVMERIYNYYINYSEEAFRKEVNVGPNGEIICEKGNYGDTKRIFKETEDGEAVFENHVRDGKEERKGEYFIDKFGMDKIFREYCEPLFEKDCIVSRTEERTLIINGGKLVVEDQGDPILNYNNFTVFRENASRTIGWEGNKDFLTKYYPITKEWFAAREGIIEKEQEEEKENKEIEPNSEVENLKNRIKTIEVQHEKEIDSLGKERDELKKEKEQLQTMLKRTLEVCESVKRSPLGKMFFGRKLKQLPEAPGEDGR